MGAVNLDFGGLIPNSLFVNDTAVAQAEGQAATNIANIQAQAGLDASNYAAELEAHTITTIAYVVAIIIFLFIIFWFLKG